jgi:two-component system response regulator MprA
MDSPSVLVIEDNHALADTLRDILVDEGYAVSLAGDGLDGLEEARRTHPDVIVLDIFMPRMDGRAFRAAQRKDPRIAQIPVLVLSVMQNDTGLDVAGFFSKPFHVRRLLEAIREIAPITPPPPSQGWSSAGSP